MVEIRGDTGTASYEKKFMRMNLKCSELMEALKEIQVPYKKFEMLAKKFDDLIEEL